MFELIIILSRYLFVFYGCYFLLQGVIYILDERKIRKSSAFMAVSLQRITIVLMHLTAFLILAYIPGEFNFNIEILKIGTFSLIFILLGQFLANKIYKNSCPLIWNGLFFLLDVGLITLQRLDTFIKSEGLPTRQLTWFIIGFILMLIIPLVLKIIPKSEKLEILYLIVSLVLIAMPLIIGTTINGSKNWVRVFGVTFQPSEVVKFLYVFYLASVFRRRKSLKELTVPIGFSALLVCILVLEKDLGGALIFFMTFIAMLYIATGNFLLIGSALLAVSFASVGAYQLFSHIRVRVSAWKNPWADISGSGYQIAHSLFAIGTWGFFGCGLTRGMPYKIYAVESDFIFAAICEEFGSIFAIVIIGIYIMIFYRGMHISLRCKRRYYSLLAAGFTSILAFQTFVIIGGVTKFIPLTGITLPFISYGGSSIVVSIMIIGILQWIYVFNEDYEDGV